MSEFDDEVTQLLKDLQSDGKWLEERLDYYQGRKAQGTRNFDDPRAFDRLKKLGDMMHDGVNRLRKLIDDDETSSPP